MKKQNGIDIMISVSMTILKVISGIFIGAIVLPLKLLENRVDVSDVEYIIKNLDEDQL